MNINMEVEDQKRKEIIEGLSTFVDRFLYLLSKDSQISLESNWSQVSNGTDPL